MKYSTHSLSQYSKKKLTTIYQNKEGVFETPQGDFIVRIKNNERKNGGYLYTTLSRHKSYDEAKAAFDFAKSGDA